jgi:hypothetical protein
MTGQGGSARPARPAWGLARRAGAIAILMLAAASAGGAGAGEVPPAGAYIIDNPTPSQGFGPAFFRKVKPTEAFPGPPTGLLAPEAWLQRELAKPEPVSRLARTLLFGRDGAADAAGFFAWLGLTQMRSAAGGEAQPIGAYPVDTELGAGYTFGCAACHSQNFFGVFVFGMANKTPRANRLFTLAKAFAQNAPMAFFAPEDAAEAALIRRAQWHLQFVGAREPQALGLDTSLAQVSLSLARRDTDAAASLTEALAVNPRPDPFDTAIADSKPMDWWPVKYKDRWLADGALVKGSFVLTNFLWNEIGRGTDLAELSAWLDANPAVIDDITRFVMTAEPPRIDDFVDDAVDTAAARRGEAHFLDNCSRCHGVYRKNWSSGYRTVSVDYPKPTKVRNVGTDPNRAAGTAYLASRLNRLALSRRYGMVLEPTGGYVPPPLVGIWSRYPYLHNRSVPNLCELLKPEAERVRRYFVGTTVTVATDFDRACVGYPLADIPQAWRTRERLFNTARTGLSNRGHNMFVDAADGDKRDLIEFLKTL